MKEAVGDVVDLADRTRQRRARRKKMWSAACGALRARAIRSGPRSHTAVLDRTQRF